MIQSKKIGIIVAIFLALSIITSLALFVISKINFKSEVKKIEMDYGTKIFGQPIISIDIIADESDWEEMLENAIRKEYIMVDVIVNGTKFKNVGIRPKGNSSLKQVMRTKSNRYSFRIKFDEYISGQTCFGLDSFVINNMFTDNTYMKEYISYDIMREIGVYTPYFGFADIKVNGEYWGFYIAVENYGDSYETRTFGTTSGMLYSVKRDGIKKKGFDFNYHGILGKDSGGSLKYTTDEFSSYSEIFDNVVGSGRESDFKRIITALRALSKDKDLDKYYDIDQILRYFAAHTTVVNLDSYSSSMGQNYYIYENEGKITILPWDYNQAWGGFLREGASLVINFPIDSPVSDVELADRPLIEKLFSKEEYLERYHFYLQKLMTEYFSQGNWEDKITEIDNLISEHVQNDSTAFCSFEEYKEAVAAFKLLGHLRYKSIQEQLDGKIPSTSEEQLVNPDILITMDERSFYSLSKIEDRKYLLPTIPPSINRYNLNGKESFATRYNVNRRKSEFMFRAIMILNDFGVSITDEVKSKLLSLNFSGKKVLTLSQKQNHASQGVGKKLSIYLGLFFFILMLTSFVANIKKRY